VWISAWDFFRPDGGELWVHCAAHLIDERQGIGRTSIGAPCHMAVRPDQDQVTFVKPGNLGIVDFMNYQWHLTGGGSVNDLIRAYGLRAKLE
jgi:hypothetical protein